jgi:pimeloyl-ACP methyl ester carboxylesterase
MPSLTTPDGRTLVVREGGAAGGDVILVHNGTPMSGLLYDAHVRDAERHGARLVSIDRPGYAGSTRRPGRAVGDVAGDVVTVLDALDVERCVTWGLSGGGPHALACAALLPERVAAAASLAGIGPYDAPDLDFLTGMGEDNLEEFGLAAKGEDALRPFLESAAPTLATADGDAFREQFTTLLAPPDVALLEKSAAFAHYFAGALADAVSAGVDGWLDDDLAFVKPWGFDPAQIAVPVQVWQGAQDYMVPAQHGPWLAGRIPGAELHAHEQDGHVTVFAARMPEIHAWLLERLRG